MTSRLVSCSIVLLAVAAAACSPAAADKGGDSLSKNNKTGGTKNVDNDDDTAQGATPPGGTPADPGEPLPDMKDFLIPQKINTGVTGGAEVFRVPIATDLTGNLSWVAADPTIVTVEPIGAPDWYAPEPGFPNLTFAIVTGKKAGTTTVSVSGGGKTAQTSVTVNAYTSAAFAVGKTRYKTGGTEANRVACASCHESPTGVDHSPSWLAYFDDADVLGAIQTAVYASDQYTLRNGDHKWNLTENEKLGIMVYLRGLPPTGWNFPAQ